MGFFFLVLIELCDVFRVRLFGMYKNMGEKFELFKVEYKYFSIRSNG